MKVGNKEEANERIAEIIEYIDDNQDFALSELPIITDETLPSWNKSLQKWSVGGEYIAGTVGEIPFIQCKDARLAKGRPLRTFTVYDLDGCRLVDIA